MTFKEDDFWSRSTIAIIGLGLMGGSLAMALHKKCKKLIGFDRDEAVLHKAMDMDLIAEAFTLRENSLSEANLIILAVPVMSIINLLGILPQLQPNPSMVLDLGSTKRMVVNQMNKLPVRFEAIGGHPMCGKEQPGLKHAEEQLFRDAIFAFTETNLTSPLSREIVISLAAMIGAIPFWIEPDQHDLWAASTSHLPYLIANSLAAITPEEVAPLASSGFASTTRLAFSSIRMMMDILKTNRQFILNRTTEYKEQIDHLIDLLQQKNDVEIEKELLKGTINLERIMARKKSGIEI